MISQPSIWGALSDAGSNSVYLLVNAGAPVDGTSGTGANLAGPGCLLVDTTNKLLYVNTNTKASPTWTNIGGPGGGSVTLTGVQTLTNKTLTAPIVTTGTFASPVLTTPALGAATGASIVLSGNMQAASYNAGATAGATAGPFTTITGIRVVAGIVTVLTGS